MAEQNGVHKPQVLVLGGVGFIGRNLVHYLVTNELAGKIRVADKVMPQMAWLNAAHKESFSKVEFKHANLINAKSVTNAFTIDGGFDYVINCAGETKLGQSEAVYKEGVWKLSLNCAREAGKCHARYIEVSSAQMCCSDKEPMREDTLCEPWSHTASYKLAVEQEMKAMSDLDYIIARPAMIYGKGDRTGLTPRLVIGSIYKYLKEKMKMLWTKDLKMNTVHVEDVCRALWHLCQHGEKRQIYMLADKSNTTQGKIGELISEIFDINHDFVGSMFTNMAKLSSSDLVEDINDKHMSPWGDICQMDGIGNTPLTPYLDEELLTCKPLYVDGSKIETTGFKYEKPELTVQLLREVLEDYACMGLFPPSLLHS